MIGSNVPCEKIRSICAEIGKCGIDVDADYDQSKEAWVVDLQKGKHRLQTHLEPPGAASCLEGKQCVSLRMQISQLVSKWEADVLEYPRCGGCMGILEAINFLEAIRRILECLGLPSKALLFAMPYERNRIS